MPYMLAHWKKTCTSDSTMQAVNFSKNCHLYFFPIPYQGPKALLRLNSNCLLESHTVPNTGIHFLIFKTFTSFLGRSETRLSSPTGYVWIKTNSHFWICIRLENKNILFSLQNSKKYEKKYLIETTWTLEIHLIKRTQNPRWYNIQFLENAFRNKVT